MDRAPEFDALATPIDGKNLIEASAGTGKTYSLSALFLRLLLEKDLPLDRVLVVTYTVAATEELKERIRKRLREALSAFATGSSEDPFYRELLARVRPREKAVRALGEALRDFDRAPIFTIHGFCQRTLQEQAFESGGFFDTELVPDVSDLAGEVARDFWRSRFYEAPAEIVSFALGTGLTAGHLISLPGRWMGRGGIKVTPELPPVTFSTLDPLRELYARLREAWPAARDAVLEILAGPAMNRTVYKNPGLLAASMDSWLDGDVGRPSLAERAGEAHDRRRGGGDEEEPPAGGTSVSRPLRRLPGERGRVPGGGGEASPLSPGRVLPLPAPGARGPEGIEEYPVLRRPSLQDARRPGPGRGAVPWPGPSGTATALP